MGTKTLQNDILDRCGRAVQYRLGFWRVPGDRFYEIHIAVVDKELRAKGQSNYTLCGAAWGPKAQMMVGAGAKDKGVCKRCRARMGILAGHVAAKMARRLWGLARGENFTLTKPELKAILADPNVWSGEPLQQAALLPLDDSGMA